METRLKRFLSLALAVLMVFSMMPQITLGASAASGDTTVYLKPDSSIWATDGAWFAAYYWNDSANGWVKMTDGDGDGYYAATIPAGYTNIIFTRNDPTKTDLIWESRWNQTADLTISGTNNLYTITGWNGAQGVGKWSHKHIAGAAATCNTAQTCTVCGEELKPATGEHDFSNNAEYCAYGCGEKNPDYVAPCEHTYKYACSTKCSVCGEGAREASHDFSNNAEYCAYGCGEKNPDYVAPCEHTYKYACSTKCSVCGEGAREASHDFSNNAEYCAYGCGEKNPNYVAPAEPIYMVDSDDVLSTTVVRMTANGNGWTCEFTEVELAAGTYPIGIRNETSDDSKAWIAQCDLVIETAGTYNVTVNFDGTNASVTSELSAASEPATTVTVYFDNSEAQWDQVYVAHGSGNSIPEMLDSIAPMTKGENDIWSAEISKDSAKVGFANGASLSAVTYGPFEVEDGKTYKYEAPKTVVAKIGDAEYTSLAAAVNAASADAVITVVADSTESSLISVAKNLTIDLGGKTVNLPGLFIVNGTVNISNGTLIGTSGDSSTVQVYTPFGAGAPVVTLTNVNVTGARHALRVEGGTATVNGGTYVAAGAGTSHAVNVGGDYASTVIIKGGKFVGPAGTTADSGSALCVQAKGIVTVENGDFSGGKTDTLSVLGDGALTISGGTYDQDPTAYVAEGYEATEAEGTWTVQEAKADPVAQIGETKYETLEEAVAAAEVGGEVTILKAGTYNVPAGKDLIITGAVDGAVFDNIGAKNMGGANVTFNNVTFNYASDSTYKGLQHSGDLVYNNCTINGQVFLYGASETFNNCTFNTTDAANYNVWTYGAKEVAFNECTFNCAGKSVLVYNEGADHSTNLTVTDCDFIASAPVEGKAAIEIDTSLNTNGKSTVVIDGNTTVTGFATGSVSGETLWNDKKDQANIDVYVDGVQVWPKRVAAIGETYYSSLHAAIDAAVDGDTITLLTDIALGEMLTVSGDVTIDGGNYTITWADGYAGTLINVASGASVTTKNLTIDGENAFTFYEDTTTVADGQNWYTRFVNVGEEDKAVNADVIVSEGNLTLGEGTKIQNVTIASTGDNGKTENTETGYVLKYNDDLAIIKSTAGAVAIDGAVISGNAGMVLNAVNVTSNINATITGNMGVGNKGGIIIINGGAANIAGTITGNKAMARSATVLGVINGAEVTSTATINSNKHIGVGSNTAGAIVVLEGASQFVMNGGSISNNVGGRAGAIASRWATADAKIELNAGSITGNTAANDSWNGASIFLRSPATIGEGMQVDGAIVVNAAPAELDITGGTFNGSLIVTEGLSAEISGGTFNYDPNAWVIEGYKGVKTGESTWTVREAEPVAQVGETLYYSLTEALNACTNGETVKVIADITYTEDDVVNAIGGATGFGDYPNPSVVYIGGSRVDGVNSPSNVNAVIDLNGHTITNNADAYLFLFMDNAKVTFKDSVGTGAVVGNTAAPIIWVTGTDTLVTIESGKYTTVNAEGLIWATHSGDLVITGGDFSTSAEDASLLIIRNTHDRKNSAYFISGKSTVTVSGGTFHGFNPEKMLDDSTDPFTEFNAVAEGFAAKTNDNGATYTVETKTEVTIGSVEELIAFGSAVTGNTKYQGVKVAANSEVVVKLTADLDLTDSGFAPMGNGSGNAFAGTFDGQNHIISNMTLSCDYYRGVGFFRSLAKGAVIKDLTFVNANVNNGAAAGGNHFYGVVAGFSNTVTLDNVDVKDSTVTCKYAGAIMVGCLEGASTIKNCDIENVTLNTTSIRGTLYGILGNSANGHTAELQNNTVSGATFTVDNEVKALKETMKYGEWNDEAYLESTYVAQIGEAKYSTLCDAVVAAAADDTITLIGDVERVAPLDISKNITLNLNGKTVESTEDMFVVTSGTLTIEGDGTVKGGTSGVGSWTAIWANGGNVVINGGTYSVGGDSGTTDTTHQNDVIYTKNGGTVVINGGTFLNDGTVWTLNENDANRGTISVMGGTFHNWDPANNVSEGAGTNFVAEGYISEETGTGVFKVVPNMIFEFHLTDANGEAHWLSPMSGNDLNSLIESGKIWYDSLQGTYDFTLKILDDCEIDETVIVNFPMTIDLGGKTVTSNGVNPAIRITNGADVTIKNGTLDSSTYCFILGASDGSSAGNLTIESGTYNGKITIASVTKGKLTVLGGEFAVKESSYGATYLLNCIDANYKDGSAVIEVKGGTFTGFDPENNAAEGANTNFCATDYISEDNGDGTWTVVKAEKPYITINTDNMELGNNLALIFWVKKAEMLEDVDYTAKLIRTFADGTTEEVMVPESQWIPKTYGGTEYYQVKYNNFAAKEMLDEISIQIFDADGKAVSNIFTDCIREYAMFALSSYSGAAYAEFRTAMVDMLNYGAAAQKEFGYNTGDLANSKLTAEQQAQATQSVTLEDHWTNPDVIGHGSNLELISNIVLHVWLKGVTSDMYAEVSYTNHTGTAVKNTVAFSEFTYRGSGIYSVPVDGLVVADGGQVATVKLYKADGTLVGTVTESIESYIKFQLTIGDANGLYDATAKFVTSAYNYFH